MNAFELGYLAGTLVKQAEPLVTKYPTVYQEAMGAPRSRMAGRGALIFGGLGALHGAYRGEKGNKLKSALKHGLLGATLGGVGGYAKGVSTDIARRKEEIENLNKVISVVGGDRDAATSQLEALMPVLEGAAKDRAKGITTIEGLAPEYRNMRPSQVANLARSEAAGYDEQLAGLKKLLQEREAYLQ